MTDTIKKPSQYDKITKLHENSEWICGNAYRTEYIFSGHKRRSEYAKKFNVVFESRKCEHGHRAVLDYKIRPAENRLPTTRISTPVLENTSPTTSISTGPSDWFIKALYGED